jgi:hypothetical protein
MKLRQIQKPQRAVDHLAAGKKDCVFAGALDIADDDGPFSKSALSEPGDLAHRFREIRRF